MDTCGGLRVRRVAVTLCFMAVIVRVSPGLPLQNTSVNPTKNIFQGLFEPAPSKQEEHSVYCPNADGPIHYSSDLLRMLNRHSQVSEFTKPVYSFQIHEDALPGTIVGCVHASFGAQENDGITYIIEEDDGGGLFLLNRITGEFTLMRPLDYECERFYILSVKAANSNSYSGVVRVYFNVIDINDNPPVFHYQTYTVSVLENLSIGSSILSLNVTDIDEGYNGDIRVTVISGDDDGKFAVDLQGVLRIMKELDREQESVFSLTVLAMDQAMPEATRLSSSAHITVYVLDVNDNAPRFLSSNNISVPENAAIGTIVTVVHAIDLDSGVNSLVEYSLDSGMSHMFQINKTSGVLSLIKELDRENTSILTLQVTAIDQGFPPRSVAMNLTISVRDVNDNDPVFTENIYAVMVAENILPGSGLLSVLASDSDEGVNGEVSYFIHQKKFIIDSFSGEISVIEMLDRESSPEHIFIVIAKDHGSIARSASATVHIFLKDVNDFTPTFFPQTTTIHVNENLNQLPRVIFQVSALDEDEGLNSHLTYLISKGNDEGQLSLSPEGKLSALKSFDREVKAHHSIEILALDSGLHALTGTGTIFIIVEDMNDNAPLFNKKMYSISVKEDSAIGSVCLRLTAMDPDAGINGEVRYSLEATNLPFSIHQSTGDIITTGELDRETQANYTLTVKACDMSVPQPLCSSVVVYVTVEDVNDMRPQFLNSPYVANVPAAIYSGSIISTVTAIDGDAEMNAKLNYSLFGPNANKFNIDPERGVIFASQNSSETTDITVNVRVADNGQIPLVDSTTVTVRFKTSNDFPQVSTFVYKHLLSEDQFENTVVARVMSYTKRKSQRGAISYYLAAGNFEDAFQVDQYTGILRVKNPLDYESNSQFQLWVEARDAGLPPFSSYSKMTISIMDMNDNSPVFTQNVYQCEVFENSPMVYVCHVSAVDLDSGANGALEYSIVGGNTKNSFSIDPRSGVVKTMKVLDREEIAVYKLIVQAKDKGKDPKAGTSMVIVNVLDKNDNAPRFSQIFLKHIPENTPIGCTVLRITSTDEDIGINGMSTYTIIDSTNNLPFKIGRKDGYITVTQPLDREITDRYIVRVNANDSAWSVNTDVTIYVSDVNDNAPVFSQVSYVAVIPEPKVPEVVVLRVNARDSDIGLNGRIFYYIKPSNKFFKVNVVNGNVITKQALNCQDFRRNRYSFTVVASDSGDVPYYSEVNVTLIFIRYNDLPPVFQPYRPLMPIPSSVDIGTKVLRLAANGSNSQIMEYSMSGGNASSFFEVEKDTGWIFVERSINLSLNMLYMMEVMATEKGIPSLLSQTQVHFLVTGDNKFTPVFTSSNLTFSVPEDLSVGSVIGRASASDSDEGLNGCLQYKIVKGSKNIFAINSRTGIITLIQSLDFEKCPSHHLEISAHDFGWKAKSSVVNVTIQVLDVNDNVPVFDTEQFIALIPENSPVGSKVIQLIATDLDSDRNAQIHYSLLQGNTELFAIDSVTGVLVTLEVFDFELQQTFDLIAMASSVENEDQFSIAQVLIHITGVNEYFPKFSKAMFNYTVSEKSPLGTTIGQVIASDYDLGADGVVFYSFIGQSKMLGFDIEHHSGKIVVSSNLRKYVNKCIMLNVIAKNGGVITGYNTDEALVVITVLDVNDAPVFENSSYHINISEDAPVGTSLIQVYAEDWDSFANWNQFCYTIKSGNKNSSFFINPSHGVIHVASPLDREQWPFYTLTIAAVDNATVPATGCTQVFIVVTDINDNGPHLTSEKAYVKENQPAATFVMLLNATDADLSPNQGPFHYKLADSKSGEYFSLSSDGLLSTAKPIDMEQTSEFHIPVIIQDSGTPAMSSTNMLRVTILDENDNPSTGRSIQIEVKYFGMVFSGGIIGNVKPEDPDVLDEFSCSVKNKGFSMVSISPESCYLISLPHHGEAEFNFTIEASDKIHKSVNNSIYLTYKGFTNNSIDNCVLIYISTPFFETFLSVKYWKLVKAINSIFKIQASTINVFAMQPLENITVLLCAVIHTNGQYVEGSAAAAVLRSHKFFLEIQSNCMIVLITSDPCSTEPCQNKASCFKSISVNPEVAILESPSIIFVSQRVLGLFTCSCPKGYEGETCESAIDECLRQPCENGGICTNYPEGFSCNCPVGYSGPYCSLDVNECESSLCYNGTECLNVPGDFRCICQPGYTGRLCDHLLDYCASSPCLPGICLNHPTGYICQCPFGVSGNNCEEAIYGFEELSYMEWPPLDPRNNILSMEFATVGNNSLLLYNYDNKEDSGSEFLALEIVNGRLQLSYNLGNGTVMLSPKKFIADGRFHGVIASRSGKVGFINVDNCSNETSGFCYSRTEGLGSERTLDVGSNNMVFGGIKSIDSILSRPGQVRSNDFIGCVKNMRLNGIPLEPSQALTYRNIHDRCSRIGWDCKSGVCLNGATCVDLWSFHLCQCPKDFTGVDCGTKISQESQIWFDGDFYFDYVIKESYRRKEMMLNYLRINSQSQDEGAELELKFKIRRMNGILLYIKGSNGFTVLKVASGKLQYIYHNDSSGKMEHIFSELRLQTDHWHILKVVRNGIHAKLFLDDECFINFTNPAQDLIGLDTERIFLGGMPSELPRFKNETGFSGCIEYFSLNRTLLPFSGWSNMVKVTASRIPVRTGCFPSTCVGSSCLQDAIQPSCLSQPCLNGGTCIAAADTEWYCLCLGNFTGPLCETCMFALESSDACQKRDINIPLWVIDAILPATIVLFLFLFFILLKFRAMFKQQQCKGSDATMGERKGTENKAFNDENECMAVQDITDAADKQPDVIKAKKACKTRAVTCVHHLEHEQPCKHNERELRYDDADSTGCIALSEAQMTHQPGLSQSVPNPQGARRLAIFCKHAEALLSPQSTVGSGNTEHVNPALTLRNSKGRDPRCLPQLPYGKIISGKLRDTQHQVVWRSPRHNVYQCHPHLPDWPSEIMDDLRKLNSPMASRRGLESSMLHVESNSMTSFPVAPLADSSSDSESHSSFTCSEYECEKDLIFRSTFEQPGLHVRTACSCCSGLANEACGDLSSDVHSQPASGDHGWHGLLSADLHFNSYAEVFEDLAELPIEVEGVSEQSFDTKSDPEEIF
ncbi:protocadherin Fat 4 [Erpetoichthys calabaricus]|uniref:protocadherin Fat 4 n=1 Tax=Erpetoichthys calabaricus TaxID=27687 RepID=UPI00223472BA|nr:protocadherin Fat 4 [Erpetoichthys calabaricus]